MTERPTLRVVRGAPSDEEIAALTAVLAAAGSSPAAETPPGPRSWWSDPAVRLRVSPRPGPGSWRASALPR